MPAKDFYHPVVVDALRADGWVITDDPLHLSLGARDFYIDLAAELPIAAEKDGVRVAIEVKSFVGASNIRDLELALGQSFSIASSWRAATRGARCSSPCRSRSTRRSSRSRWVLSCWRRSRSA